MSSHLYKKKNKIEPYKSVEGYIVFANNLNEDVNEENIDDLFSEYGNVKNIQMNLNRKTGKMNGYCFVEYENLEEAEEAIKNLNNTKFLNKIINVDFAFKPPPTKK
jgi:RNA-binding protein 8A